MGARARARQAELCAFRVCWRLKDGYEKIFTVPSPVVARRSRSGEDSVGMWYENVVAFVCVFCGWDGSIVYVYADAFCSDPFIAMPGVDGLSTETGTRVSS